MRAALIILVRHEGNCGKPQAKALVTLTRFLCRPGARGFLKLSAPSKRTVWIAVDCHCFMATSRAPMFSTAITHPKRAAAAVILGMAIGTLGGLIGLGGAEFRLPVLISFFGFVALEAVILNKAISLVVVASALVFRAHAIRWGMLRANGQSS